MGLWRIPFRPAPALPELPKVVADLEQDDIVDLSTHGTVLHSEQCAREHGTPLASKRIESHFASRSPDYVAIATFPSEQSEPTVWVSRKGWDRSVLAGHPHLNEDGSSCVLYPPNDDWNPVRNDLADFMDQVSLWTLKTEVWVARGSRKASVGWPGSGQGHEIDELLRTADYARCQCGSGFSYALCCRPDHLKLNKKTLIKRNSLEGARYGVSRNLLSSVRTCMGRCRSRRHTRS